MSHINGWLFTQHSQIYIHSLPYASHLIKIQLINSNLAYLYLQARPMAPGSKDSISYLQSPVSSQTHLYARAAKKFSYLLNNAYVLKLLNLCILPLPGMSFSFTFILSLGSNVSLAFPRQCSHSSLVLFIL